MKTLLLTFLYFPAAVIGLTTLTYLFYECFNLLVLFVPGVFLAYWIAKKSLKLKKPFMLAGLVFVTAIIFIFLFLVSLNTARSNSPTASIKQSLGNLRSYAELVYGKNDYSYEKVCEDEQVNQLIESANDHALEIGNGNCFGVISRFFMKEPEMAANEICTSSETEYKVKLYMPVYDLYWCVDSVNAPKFPFRDGDGVVQGEQCE